MSGKDTRQLLRAAEKFGAVVRRTRAGHYRVTGPGGVVTLSSSTSDRRARTRQLADLRRIGVNL